MQLHTYVMNRLLRWKLYVLWCSDALTSAPGPRKVRSSWHLWLANVRSQSSAPAQRAACPVDEIECGITQLCIEQLPEPLREAVLLGYLASGKAEDKALELGISRRAYFYHLDRAYSELLGLFNDHEAGVKRVDLDHVNAELDAARVHVPECGAVTGKLRRPAMHGIARDVRVELAPPKKAAAGA